MGDYTRTLTDFLQQSNYPIVDDKMSLAYNFIKINRGSAGIGRQA